MHASIHPYIHTYIHTHMLSNMWDAPLDPVPSSSNTQMHLGMLSILLRLCSYPYGPGTICDTIGVRERDGLGQWAARGRPVHPGGQVCEVAGPDPAEQQLVRGRRQADASLSLTSRAPSIFDVSVYLASTTTATLALPKEHCGNYVRGPEAEFRGDLMGLNGVVLWAGSCHSFIESMTR